jgi:hypothetical protein
LSKKYLIFADENQVNGEKGIWRLWNILLGGYGLNLAKACIHGKIRD